MAGPARGFGYNHAGHLISATAPDGAVHTLTWDQEAHLASVTKGSDVSAYVYDADGARLIARNPTSTTLYLPDGTELTAPTSGGPAVGTRYVAGVAVRTVTGLRWTATNHQGTSLIQIDATTLVADRRRMLPYGEPRGTNPAGWIGTKGYVGGTTDPTGYTHLGAREYDPTIGRFISIDPIMDLTDPQQWHGYSYANGSPVSFSDPSGLYLYEDVYGGGQKAYGGGSGKKASGGGGGKKAKVTGKSSASPADGLTLGSERPDPLTVGQMIGHQFCGSEAAYCGHLEELDPFDQQRVLGLLFCYNNPGACRAAQEAEMAKNGIYIQIILVAAGMIPGVGEAFDIASAASALAGGDWDEAGLAVGSAIPFVGEGPAAVRFAKLMRELNDLPGGCFKSFTAQTQVLLAAGGTKSIGEIQVGDVVIATDPITGEQGARPVTHVWVHQDSVVDLELEGGHRITTTEDHSFWNSTVQVWEEAHQLDPGDHLRTPGATQGLRVVGLDHSTERVELAYNLTVVDLHTYYVVAGDTPVLVHNCTPLTTAETKKLGGLADFADMTAAAMIKQRGGGASQINQLQSGYGQMTLRDLAHAAVNGDKEAEKAIKMIKQAGSQGKGGK